MLGSLYNSMTGLYGFTQALDNLSNNVSNLNTPGYKGNDLIFRELGAENSSIQGQNGNGEQNEHGEGVLIVGSDTRFTQGDIKETGGETDIAISGDAFFVLENEGERYFTRSGQFRFDPDGYLVDPATGYKVVMIDENGGSTFLNINDYKSSDPEKTTKIELQGLLENSQSEGAQVPAEDQSGLEVNLFDEGGKEYKAYLRFEKQEGNQWQLMLTTENGTLIAPTHTIDFTSLGSIVSDTAQFSFDFQEFDILENESLEDAFALGQIMEFPDGLSQDVNTSFELTDAQLIGRSESEFQFLSEGPWHFDSTGRLVDDNGLRIAALEDGAEIVDFSIRDMLETPEELTEYISLAGNLNSDIEIGSSYPPESETGIEIEYIGSNGETESLFARFVREDTSEWSLIVEGDDGTNYDVAGALYFNNEGQLVTSTSALLIQMSSNGGEDININLTDESGDPLLSQLSEASAMTQSSFDGKERGFLRQVEFDEAGQATLHYSNGDSEPGPTLAVVKTAGNPITGVELDLLGLSGVTSGQSQLSVKESDGRSLGQIIDFSFNEQGEVDISYSNLDSQATSAIALANILDKSQLYSSGGTLFKLQNNATVNLGTVSSGAGRLEAASLELSNVELSREFADIIIVQRGYQASSQVLNVTNELIEELYNSVKGR